MDQRRKRTRLLLPARVMQPVAASGSGNKERIGERLAPIVQDANECAGAKMLANLILPNEGQSDAIKHSADHDLHVVNDQGPLTATDSDFLPFSNSHR